MAVKKLQPAKVGAIATLKERVSKGQDYVFTNYRGMTVAQITALRAQLRALGAEYKVVKNTFTRIVLEQLSLPRADSYLTGPTAVAICKNESGPVAKALLDFTREVPALEVKGGIFNGGVYDAKQVEAFSKLPGRMELLGILMGTMKAPVQNLVGSLHGIVAKLARTLQAVADKKQQR